MRSLVFCYLLGCCYNEALIRFGMRLYASLMSVEFAIFVQHGVFKLLQVIHSLYPGLLKQVVIERKLKPLRNVSNNIQVLFILSAINE